MTATAWESAGVVVTAILTAIALVYTVSARPKIRAFYDIPYEKQGGTWVELGCLIYVTNVGRAAAMLRSAGLRGESGTVSCKAGVHPKLAGHLTPGHAPMVLKPGDLVTFFTTDWPRSGSGDQFGALEFRTWRFGGLAAKLPAGVRRRVPRWTYETWHPAHGPEREPSSQSA